MTDPSRPRPRLLVPRPRPRLQNVGLEIKTAVSRTTSLDLNNIQQLSEQQCAVSGENDRYVDAE